MTAGTLSVGGLGARLLAVSLVGLFGAACAPTLRGTSDLRLRELLTSGSASPEAIAPLLAPDVEVHRAGGTVRGIDAGAAELADVTGVGAGHLERHHDVSLMSLGDGRVLLMQRGEQDLVTRAVELRSPTRADGLPRRLYFYGAAWNTDDATARRALLDASWATHGHYVDPGHVVDGVEEVNVMIGNLRRVVPGSMIKFATGVADVGGGWAIDHWVMLAPVGQVVIFRGIDVMHRDAEGKIDFLAGFIKAGS